MTIDVSRINSINLYSENGSLLFDSQQVGLQSTPPPPLGAVSLIARRNNPSQGLQDLAVACGREAFTLAKLSYNESYKWWLFVSDGPWREATRIVRHQKLWKNHRDLVGASIGGHKSDEVAFEAGGKVRYAGLLEISDGLIDKAIDSTRVSPSFAIILSNRDEIILPTSIESIFFNAFNKKSGFERTSVDWMSLAIALCPQGDILMRVSGLFDDREAAVDLIATPDNLP